jgi:hypothetical protein
VPPLLRGRTRRRASLLSLLSIGLILVFLAPYGGGLFSPARGTPPAAVPPLVTSVSGEAFWNGVNANTASTPATAFSWSFSDVAHIKFQWAGPVIGPEVSQASLVVNFLGLPAYTKQQVLSVPQPVGSVNMTYDLSQYKWLLQGLFELHGHLADPNGTVLWNENFYVRVSQPYDIVIATVGLLILTLVELYLIATVGPRAADKAHRAQRAQAEPATTSENGGSNPPGKS